MPVALIGLVGWWHVSWKRPHEKHIRGTEIFSLKTLRKRLRQAGAPGIQIGGVHVPSCSSARHMVVAGATGSGKDGDDATDAQADCLPVGSQRL